MILQINQKLGAMAEALGAVQRLLAPNELLLNDLREHLFPTRAPPAPLDSSSGPRAIVSAASFNHFDVLVGFLDSVHQFNPTHIPVFVYDLGLSAPEHDYVRERYPWVTLRRFDYSTYPDWFDIRVARGEYAWKPVIIKEMLDSTAHQVLWLDSTGDRLTSPSVLQNAFAIIKQNGWVSTKTSGTTQTWVHPKTLEYLHAIGMDKRMCNGAILGFDRTHSDIYDTVVVPWEACALVRHCIAPPGSSRANHRQDQATVTVLLHKSGRDCIINEGDWNSGTMHPGPLGIKLHQDGLAKTKQVSTTNDDWCGGEYDMDQKRMIPLRGGVALCNDARNVLNQKPPYLFNLVGSPDISGGGRKAPFVRLDAQKHSDTRPEISMVMPVYNAATALRRSLPALFDTAVGSWELIVVLDACHDASYDVVRAVASDAFERATCLRVRVVEQPTAVWETSSDNLGMRISNPSHAYMLIQADNIMVEHGWNERMLRELTTDNRVFGVSARCGHNIDATIKVGRCGPDIANPLPPNVNRSQFHVTETVNRGPLMLHANRTRALGFLDETRFFLENDEHDLNRRALARGWQVGYLPIDFFAPLDLSARRNSEFRAYTPKAVQEQERRYKAYRIQRSRTTLNGV
jgi:hypothetical protein